MSSSASASKPPPADDGWSTPSPTALGRRRDRASAAARTRSPSPNPQAAAAAVTVTEPSPTAPIPTPGVTQVSSFGSNASGNSLAVGSPPREGDHSPEAHRQKITQSRIPTPTPGDPRTQYPSTFEVPTSLHSPYSHRSSLITHPSVPIKFLVLDCPSDALMPEYVAILKENGIQDVVRICEEKAYNKQLMEKEGIKVWDTMKFEDGGVPSDQVVADWHALVDRISAMPNPPQHGVATHCVSGIGRAPLFVAMSLIDAGLDPLDAIDVVRKRRRGAFNKRQVDWLLDGYKGRKGGGVAKKKDEPGKGGGLFGGLFGKKKAK